MNNEFGVSRCKVANVGGKLLLRLYRSITNDAKALHAEQFSAGSKPVKYEIDGIMTRKNSGSTRNA